MTELIPIPIPNPAEQGHAKAIDSDETKNGFGIYQGHHRDGAPACQTGTPQAFPKAPPI